MSRAAMKPTIFVLLLATACTDHGESIGEPPDRSQTRGIVAINEGINFDGDPQAFVRAVFGNNPVWGTVAAIDGRCTSFRDAPMEGYSAGAVAVSGTTSALAIMPSGTSPHVAYTTTSAPPADLFESGATITVSAAGAEFPAFSATLVAPSPIEPAVPDALSRSTDTTIRWNAGSGPTVWIDLLGIDFVANQSRLVQCEVPDTGSYTLTPSNLALLPASFTPAGDRIPVIVSRVAVREIATAWGDVSIVVQTAVAGAALVTP
jgi:hypothetical protein